MREVRHVHVAEQAEIWRLAWKKKPQSFCGPREVISAITCPCFGFGYGERGILLLQRFLGAKKVDEMNLGSLFSFQEPVLDEDRSGRIALLQRWPLEDDDLAREEEGDWRLVREITQRPETEIMTLADYNRDGMKAEFLVQVTTLPCGKRQFAAVGVSRKNPRLHAVTSAAFPNKPLVMPRHAWQALSETKTGTVVTWDCDDHSSEVRTELEFMVDDETIHIKTRAYSCPSSGGPERLVEESDG